MLTIRDSQKVQWWLAELDQYDNVSKLIDGAHSEQSGANQAYYLIQRLGLSSGGKRLAVVRCEVFEPVPDASEVNEDAIDALNMIRGGNR